MGSKEPCIRWGTDPPGEGALLRGTYAGPWYPVPMYQACQFFPDQSVGLVLEPLDNCKLGQIFIYFLAQCVYLPITLKFGMVWYSTLCVHCLMPNFALIWERGGTRALKLENFVKIVVICQLSPHMGDIPMKLKFCMKCTPRMPVYGWSFAVAW